MYVFTVCINEQTYVWAGRGRSFVVQEFVGKPKLFVWLTTLLEHTKLLIDIHVVMIRQNNQKLYFR